MFSINRGRYNVSKMYTELNRKRGIGNTNGNKVCVIAGCRGGWRGGGRLAVGATFCVARKKPMSGGTVTEQISYMGIGTRLIDRIRIGRPERQEPPTRIRITRI